MSTIHSRFNDNLTSSGHLLTPNFQALLVINIFKTIVKPTLMTRRFYPLIFAFLFLTTLTLNAQVLVHYWNFNNSASEAELLAPSQSVVGGAAITHIQGGASEIQITSNINQGFEVTNPNARNGDESGTHLRFNNPIGGTLLISLPTTGFQQVVVRYATRRSGSGAGTQIIEYTTDGVLFDTLTTLDPVDGDPTLQTLDFSAISEVNDNTAFQIRITFTQGPGGTVGNNRFDNLTLDAIQAGADTTPPFVTFTPSNDAIDISPDVKPLVHFNEDIRLIDDSPIFDLTIPTYVKLHADSIDGAIVNITGSYENRTITINPTEPLENGRLYVLSLWPNFVEDTSDNAITSLQVATFRIIPTQTMFQPGDIVPVAYRMNASGGEDEVAFLTFVNILPGTKINMTDAKYTDNPQPQCPGGITWTSPKTVLPSGSVFIVQNDAGSASVGTVTGSTFGLSSNGDQMIVYTGTADNPSYVTALSSNAWVMSPHMACGGSLSLIPSGLEDGTSAINLSTAPGNESGNTVNAYYNGIQTGADSTLRKAILDPAHWVGIGAGTPPQVWPDYNFPGPPSIVDARVLNQSAIQIVYNRDMDMASATDLANYTGIADLSQIQMTDNGALPDTVVLDYLTPFQNGSTHTLEIADVMDSEGRPLADVYTFTFDYITSIRFNNRFTSVSEDVGSVRVTLSLEFPSESSVEIVYRGGDFSTTDTQDFNFGGETYTFDGNSGSAVTLNLPIIDDSRPEQDEYLVLELVNNNDLTIDGSSFYTIYIRDNDNHAPHPTGDISLEFISRYTVDNPEGEEGLAEIVAFDPFSQRLFTISTALKQFDIVDFSIPTNPQPVKVVSTLEHGVGVTSIASRGGVVAVSVPGPNNEQENGSILFYNSDGDFQNKVTVGVLPDMITFAPDGQYLLTCDEGQPDDSYQNDPEGSISIIDLRDGVLNLDQNDVTTMYFTDYNPAEAALLEIGVRKLKASSTLSQDFEPEYLTVSKDSKTAWAILQENNAYVQINLENKTFEGIWALGTKDYSAVGNGLDLSDQGGFIHLSNWPLNGYYLPDAIANYSVGDVTYLVTANEGDEKEYGGLNERTTVGAVDLDPDAFPNADMLQENHNMGRFRITNLSGDRDGDGDFDELYCVGARSFSIWNAETGTLVFDSGDAFERITSQLPHTAPIFNADNGGNGFKNRSRAKGPEPEGVTITSLNDRYYAFITLERIGGVMVYDITDPFDPVFTDYINTRDNTQFAGDNGPEGVLYIPHPNGDHYLVTANEISGTLAIFHINNVIVSDQPVTVTEEITIQPNLTRGGMVHLSQPSAVAVYDLNGQLMLYQPHCTAFSTHRWPAGMYVVKPAQGSSQKLVVTE
jgi:hypothetical protein